MKYNLSEITDVIKNRRTIYPENYSSRKVHREIVENILNNAIWAPTHGRTEPWHFKVFMKEGVAKVTSFIAETYKEITPDYLEAKYEKMLARKEQASVVIALIMKRGGNAKIPEIEEVEAVSCAVQNMMLSSTAYGLGSFWQTGPVTYSKQVKSFLELEDQDKCLGFFYMGYPDIEEWPKSHRKPIEYKTDWITE